MSENQNPNFTPPEETALEKEAREALLAVERPLYPILALFPYLTFWGGAALALARRRPLWTALPVLMPFAPAAAMISARRGLSFSTSGRAISPTPIRRSSCGMPLAWSAW